MTFLSDAEKADLRSSLLTHVGRPWHGRFAEKPRGVVDPCGDCGKPMDEHPIPFARGRDNTETAQIIITLLDEVAEKDKRLTECDEALTECEMAFNVQQRRLTTLELAIERVRELHEADECFGVMGGEPSWFECTEERADWPCATIRAIDDALRRTMQKRWLSSPKSYRTKSMDGWCGRHD